MMAYLNLNSTGPERATRLPSGASRGTATTAVWARFPGSTALAHFLAASTAAIARRRRSARQRELLLGLSREQLVDAGIPLEYGQDPRLPPVALPSHVILGR